MAALFKHRWLTDVLALVVLVIGVVVVTLQLPHNPLGALIGGGVSLVLVAWLFRLRTVNRPDTNWDQAREALDAGRTVVFWKPGCGYCARLRRELRHDTRIAWVNVYQDDAADQVLRTVNDGDQLTPTVLVPTSFAADGAAVDRDVDVLRNPSAAELRAELTRSAPG